jgi:putative ABC transport system permease protein
MDQWGWRWLEQLLQDIQFGARTLRKSPGFTAATVVTLALATGATTSIFSIVHGVLLRPLPFDDPARLVQVFGRMWAQDHDGVPDPVAGPVGSPELEQYEKQATSFDGFAGYEVTTRHLTGPAGPERLTAVMADRTLFTVLHAHAIEGRVFDAGDSVDVVVISESLWERRFGGKRLDPNTTITLDGRPFTLLGVMPERFQFPYRAASLMAGALPEARTDVWVPMPPLRQGDGTLRRGRVSVVARLKPGTSLTQSTSELAVIAARVEQENADFQRRIGVRLAPLADVVVGPVRRSLWMLLAAVGLVVAAACANVANLLLARMTVRTPEVATRAALGAGALRLMRQFLAESLLLSFAGGLIGAVFARWSLPVLLAAASGRIPRAHEIALDWRAFAFLLVLCVVTAILFGLAPALVAARVDLQSITKDGGRATRAGTFGRVRDGLVILEVALAFVLATGAALIAREIVRLQHVPTGMETRNALSVHITPPTSAGNYYAIEERVAAIPGVHAAGFTQLTPLQNWGWEATFTIRNRPSDNPLTAGLRYVTPGYFSALGIPIVRGRALTNHDTGDTPPVILVNEAFARRFFPGGDAVGQELNRGTIVGVVGDVRQVSLDRDADPELYYPAAQNVTMASDIGMSLIVRTEQRPERAIAAIRAAVRDVDPGLAIFNVKTMEEVVNDSMWQLNLYRWLIGVFASLTLALAAIGLYGVISFGAASRLREFAVRLALGSGPRRLIHLVVMRGVILAGAGLVAGIATVLAVTPWARSVSPALAVHAATYLIVSGLVVAIALGASMIPAVRAAHIDPATALRHE